MLIYLFIVPSEMSIIGYDVHHLIVSMNVENSSASLSNLLVPPFFPTSDVMMLKSPARIQWRLLERDFKSSRSRSILLFSSSIWGPYTLVHRIIFVFLMICMLTKSVFPIASTAIRFITCEFHKVRIPLAICCPLKTNILYLLHCFLLIVSILSTMHFVSWMKQRSGCSFLSLFLRILCFRGLFRPLIFHVIIFI
jgi:hypothetical protein